MTPGSTPETELTPELIDRVMRLSRDDLGRPVGLALDRLDGPAADPDAAMAAMREELTRRWGEMRTGAAPTYTPAGVIAYARERVRRGKPR